MLVLADEDAGVVMTSLYGPDVADLLIEQLQSDEESTDSEMGKTVRDGHLSVVVPSWRSDMVKINVMVNGKWLLI